MEPHILNKLADKYWQGECTDLEEQQLREVLLQKEVPPGHEPLAEYMRFLNDQELHTVLDQEFDDHVMSQVEQSAKQNRRRSFLRIAAVVALGLGLAFALMTQQFNNETPQVSEFVDTYQDSEQAYAEVKKALMMVSTEMNYGMQQTEKLSKFNEIKTELEFKNKKH